MKKGKQYKHTCVNIARYSEKKNQLTSILLNFLNYCNRCLIADLNDGSQKTARVVP